MTADTVPVDQVQIAFHEALEGLKPRLVRNVADRAADLDHTRCGA